jgi:hypothetical protein
MIMTPEARKKVSESLQQGRPAILRLGVTGAVISIKRNARLTFPKPGGGTLAGKIGLPSNHRWPSGSLAREIKARKLLARLGNPVPVPTLIRYDRKRLSWLEEQYVAETMSISDSHKWKLFLIRYAVCLYSSTARSRPVSVFLRRMRVNISGLEDVFREIGVAMPNGIEGASWPVALLHGDLGPSNMILDVDGNFFLIDWEKCVPGPIASDLARLARQAGLIQSIGGVLRALSDPADLTPKAQLQVALALRLIKSRRKYSTLIDSSKNKEVVLQRIKAKQEIILASIFSLRDAFPSQAASAAGPQ